MIYQSMISINSLSLRNSFLFIFIKEMSAAFDRMIQSFNTCVNDKITFLINCIPILLYYFLAYRIFYKCLLQGENFAALKFVVFCQLKLHLDRMLVSICDRATATGNFPRLETNRRLKPPGDKIWSPPDAPCGQFRDRSRDKQIRHQHGRSQVRKLSLTSLKVTPNREYQ